MILLSMLKKILRGLTPPFLYAMLSHVKSRIKRKGLGNKSCWQTVRTGDLKGRQLFLPKNKNSCQESMLEGTYDQFIFEYIKQLGIRKDAVIFDIGSYIGYHALTFAAFSGGAIYAFEPNIYNLEVLRLNLEKNKDLMDRIQLLDVAIADRTGEEVFYFSNDTNGKSSGSFVDSADTYYAKTENFLDSFKKTTVKTFSIDDLLLKDQILIFVFCLMKKFLKRVRQNLE